MLSAQVDKPPKLKHAATTGNRLMISRFGGLTCALHAGGDRGNAGSFVLFADGLPILVETPNRTSLPVIDGLAQLIAPGENAPESAFGADICPSDFETRPDRDLFSVDLTNAWPVRLGAHSIQRTVMALRKDKAIQQVDAFDLEKPANITFRFITPQSPEMIKPDGATTVAVRLGPVTLSWEGEMRCEIAVLDERFSIGEGSGELLRCISLTPLNPVKRAFFPFCFARTSV